MAKPQKDPRTGEYRYRPMFRGKQIFINLTTTKEREAIALSYGIDRAIRDLETGQRTVPTGVDTLEWIKSGGTKTAPLTQPHTLQELILSYQASLVRGSKASSTIYTERIHFKNLTSHFGKETLLSDLTLQSVEGYVRSRKGVTPVTLKKELATLGLIWRYGERIGWVVGKPPCVGVRLPRAKQKERFRTFSEIEELVKEDPEGDHKDLWECCILIGKEMKEFLDHIRTIKDPPYVAPMILTAAYTGARRSELMRSKRRDWDLRNRSLAIRERKRIHSSSESFRYVQIHPELVKVIKPYLKTLEGDLMFSDRPDQELSPVDAERVWYHAVKGTKWGVLRGWHVMRHSYATMLGSSGVPDLTLRKVMGHTTAEMQARYRHLVPEDLGRVTQALDSYSG